VRLADVSWTNWWLGVIGGLVMSLTGIAMAALLSPLARSRSNAIRTADPVRMPAAGGSQFHGREKFGRSLARSHRLC
jgi:hypothetical protein